MKILWDAFAGIAAAFTTTLLVVGAIALAMTEGMVLPAAAEAIPTDLPTTEESFFPGFATSTPRPTQRPTQNNRLVVATTKPAAQVCPTPFGWERITVSNSDTLNSLAAARGVSPDVVMDKNCLVSASLVANSQLYLPLAVPTQTPQPLAASDTPAPSFTPSLTPQRCGPPRTWVRYTVQQGDNLFRLSTIYNVSVPELQLANCLGWSSVIRAGEIVFVPFAAPRYTATYPATATPISPTQTPVPPTRTVRPPTATFTLVPTTRTPIPVFTPTFTATSAPIFTPTFTATFIPTMIETQTAVPGVTTIPFRTPTPKVTATFTPTGK